jgi:PAS domain S-box-containing protein
MAVGPTMTLLGAALVAVAALAVVIALLSHASTSRKNEDRIDAAIAQLNSLQVMPWRLRASSSATANNLAGARALTLATERSIADSLAELIRNAPVAGRSTFARPLHQNFAYLNQMLELVARGSFGRAGQLGASAFATHNQVVGTLDRASEYYRDDTATASLEATSGSIAIVLLLLCGFSFFYLRAYKAHAATDALAGKLQLSQTHLEQAQRVAGVGSWEWDSHGRIISWSAEHGRLHGWTDPEPPSSSGAVLELISPEDRTRFAASIGAAFVEGGAVELDYRVRQSSGGRLIHVHATAVTDSDGTRRMIGTSRDLTERFQRAEAERANSAKNEFISRMSHELRTPLNAVLGFGQLLTMSDLDERQYANVEHILSAGQHLLDLINELLDISRIESGDLRLSLEPVRMSAVIADAIDLVTPIADPRKITVRGDLREDLWVRADVQRLRQVLLNLLANAVKYNHDNGSVHVLASRAAGDRVEIVVQDDGPGIAPAMIDRLFSPFERLGAEQGAVEGTGLGLAVSRGMIEAMGGRITARSELGRGAAFTIDLEAAPRNRALGAGPCLNKPADVTDLLRFVDHASEALGPAA